jgi:hypothetical protein
MVGYLPALPDHFLYWWPDSPSVNSVDSANGYSRSRIFKFRKLFPESRSSRGRGASHGALDLHAER